ncbi:MAG: hypothetical protein PWQ37_1129 [Candidatus Petromonas sp.]|jgi:hypothetical protein|nr:hypothetical protein [Candidatus Petromonas sp.]
MAKRFAPEELDKEERIRRHALKQKSKLKKRSREEDFKVKSGKRRQNKNNWMKNYDLYDLYDEYEYEDEY